MENDFEIEVRETEEAQEQVGVQLPMNFLSFGEIAQDDVKVYIKQSTYKELEKLAQSDTTKELGSILIGDYAFEQGKTHVIIEEYVEAKYTDASASTLTFTHETWEYVHSQQEENFPEKKIIGWQHTHPNYGIFLSNYDLFIQENFFNLPFQVAYVIDPIQNIRGFFQWKDGKIEKLKGFYIYDEVGKPIKIEQTRKKEEKQEVAAKPSKGMTTLVTVLSVLALILSIVSLCTHASYSKQLEQQNASIQALQGAAVELMMVLQEQQATLQTQAETIEQLKTASGEETPEQTQDTVQFVVHTVKAGDSLASICQEHGIDYYANLRMIMGLNGIENGDMIYVGQNILLPVLD